MGVGQGGALGWDRALSQSPTPVAAPAFVPISLKCMFSCLLVVCTDGGSGPESRDTAGGDDRTTETLVGEDDMSERQGEVVGEVRQMEEEEEEGKKWNCSQCTFSNHPQLGKD